MKFVELITRLSSGYFEILKPIPNLGVTSLTGFSEVAGFTGSIAKRVLENQL
jgi:hypothetical protein